MVSILVFADTIIALYLQICYLHLYLQIPYAAPPVGKNRLLPPQPVQPWKGRVLIIFMYFGLEIYCSPGVDLSNMCYNRKIVLILDLRLRCCL